MAQKLRKSALMFGQAAQPEPPKPSLSEFYKGVGTGQAGAVQEIGKGVQKETEKIPGQFGIEYSGDGKAQFSKDSAFKPTVTPTTTTTVTAPPEGGYTTSEQAAKAAETAGKAIETLGTEEKAAETQLGESTQKSLEKMGEAAKELQDKLTKGKLGERREASELEKSAQDYRNILQTTPGTSNIGAVASLMKFYDMSKYGALESGLRQGEIALARQAAGATEQQLTQAEGERAGAVQQFKETSDQAYDDTKKAIEAEKKTQLENIKKYYDTERGKQQTIKETAEKKQIELKADAEKFDVTLNQVRNNPTISGLDNILNSLSGRAGDNWLNVRGQEVLRPFQGALKGLSEETISIQNDPNLSVKQRTQKLEDLNERINQYRGGIANELAAFLADTNTSSGDALDAAELIASAGLVDSLSPENKNMILDRIKRDKHISTDKYHVSTPQKLKQIYEAFGGQNAEDDLFAVDLPGGQRVYRAV